MIQESLFHVDIWQALNTDIMRAGGFQKVGHLLRPEKSPDDAGRWLANAVDPDRKDKLDAAQILVIKRLARKAGSYATILFEVAECHLSKPEPIEPEDEQARLYREYIEATKLMKAINDRMERVNQLREVS